MNHENLLIALDLAEKVINTPAEHPDFMEALDTLEEMAFTHAATLPELIGGNPEGKTEIYQRLKKLMTFMSAALVNTMGDKIKEMEGEEKSLGVLVEMARISTDRGMLAAMLKTSDVIEMVTGAAFWAGYGLGLKDGNNEPSK